MLKLSLENNAKIMEKDAKMEPRGTNNYDKYGKIACKNDAEI